MRCRLFFYVLVTLFFAYSGSLRAADCKSAVEIGELRIRVANFRQETLDATIQRVDLLNQAADAESAVLECERGRSVLRDAVDTLALKGDRCNQERYRYNRIAQKANLLEVLINAKQEVAKLYAESLARAELVSCK